MAVVLTASACDASGSTHAGTTAAATRTAHPMPASRPALTKQEALTQIARYSEINNEANATRDRALLSTIEDGALYAMSVSEYKETEGLPASERTPYKPWAYDTTSAKLYIPRFTAGQQHWFAAALSSQKSKAPSRIAVFAEHPKDKRWEMESVVDLDSTTLPNVALDQDGYATAVAANGTNQLAAGADVLRAAVIDNFATAGTTTGTKVFAPTTASKRQIQVHDQTVRQYGDKGTSVFAGTANHYPDAYALKTADGGALILFAHMHTQTDAVANPGLQINPGKDDRAWLHDIPRSSIRYTFVCTDAATVPVKAAPARLLGYTCARTDASGPPAASGPATRA
ncbi:hypothetical protein ACH47Z_28360 [Streptomyces sp. NPDC020192]|uniref:hypothetical protein n=1 Tax=Streptomyces sp. NPDC020192 TaxID=3365066 RepID=UPI0037B55B14